MPFVEVGTDTHNPRLFFPSSCCYTDLHTNKHSPQTSSSEGPRSFPSVLGTSHKGPRRLLGDVRRTTVGFRRAVCIQLSGSHWFVSWVLVSVRHLSSSVVFDRSLGCFLPFFPTTVHSSAPASSTSWFPFIYISRHLAARGRIQQPRRRKRSSRTSLAGGAKSENKCTVPLTFHFPAFPYHHP